ncbi:MAG: acyl-CoA thioesterase [Paracoccaceae bacterium]
MYPFVRLAKEIIKFRNAAPLGPFDAHVSTHRIWPWDLDPWRELNNGRTLTLFDLGRLPLFIRMGIARGVAKQGWGLTVAGNTTRYRRRLTVFQKVTMISRCIGWDARFFYMEQSFWRGDECTSHMLIRAAVVGKSGIIPPATATETLGIPSASPALPAWVQSWIVAEDQRPWPPQR